MSCRTDEDCWLGEEWGCRRAGSRLFCSKDGGCACTLPPSSWKLFVVISIGAAVGVALYACLCGKGGRRNRNPEFIPSPHFDGEREGYVFTTRKGRTGYYRERADPTKA